MIVYHDDIVQGTDEWLAIRCGKLTASEMKLIITPSKLQFAESDKCRAHVYELLAQRISSYVEPHFVSDDMSRGRDDELEARWLYSQEHGQVRECGFVTNDKWGFTIGYSPDGFVGDDGLIECKSRRQKFQVETFLDWHATKTPPSEFTLQCQTGMLVTERKWCDLVSYSGGLPLCVMRIHEDPKIQDAIVEASGKFEKQIERLLSEYNTATRGLKPTKRRVIQDMFIQEATATWT